MASCLGRPSSDEQSHAVRSDLCPTASDKLSSVAYDELLVIDGRERTNERASVGTVLLSVLAARAVRHCSAAAAAASYTIASLAVAVVVAQGLQQ